MSSESKREKRSSYRAAFIIQLPVKKQLPAQCPTLMCIENKAPIILGGSSGVGLEVARYFRSAGQPFHAFSRSTGHELARHDVSQRILSEAQGGVAVCIGAGKRKISIAEELNLYNSISSSIAKAKQVDIVVAVVRSLVLPEVRDMFSSMLSSPWVILRPGALVDPTDSTADTNSRQESLLVTTDIRCNGLASRCGVARVAGDILMNKLPFSILDRKVFGVYDEARMIQRPPGCVFIGRELWQ